MQVRGDLRRAPGKIILQRVLDGTLAFKAISYLVRISLPTLLAEQRHLTMDDIRAQFTHGETQQLLDCFASLHMLTSEEVAKLAGIVIEIGSHGVDHEIHHANQPAEVRLPELTQSKAELEAHLRRPCRFFFAYPNNDSRCA